MSSWSTSSPMYWRSCGSLQPERKPQISPTKGVALEDLALRLLLAQSPNLPHERPPLRRDLVECPREGAHGEPVRTKDVTRARFDERHRFIPDLDRLSFALVLVKQRDRLDERQVLLLVS